MLVLTRKAGERITIGDQIVLVISKVSGNRVTVGIEAPAGVRIVRGELQQQPAPEERPGNGHEPSGMDTGSLCPDRKTSASAQTGVLTVRSEPVAKASTAIDQPGHLCDAAATTNRRLIGAA